MIAKAKKEVRVRIAPSPTGYLHIGTARTALFNWLYARKSPSGSFILRVEDTDLERSDPKFEKDIIDGLRWLGLDWNEGPDIGGPYAPYRQSERLDTYEKYIKQLLADNYAYYCYCTKEELEAERQAMLAQGLAPKYSGKCRGEQKQEREPQLIRFKMPETKLSFKDTIRGEISFDASLIGDIAIAKNLRAPLYNFAVVVDDHEMAITHVIRGEDHIANTPKQLMLQKALNFPHPQYAHLPLILDPDRSKMSKRYSAVSINEYRKDGYLPEALFNFMALLGWHPAIEKEIMDKEELIELFDLQRVQKAGAVFDIQKLDWLNSQYIKNLDDKNLLARLIEFGVPADKLPKSKILKIIPLAKERMKKLTDFMELSDFFFELPDYPAELLIWKETPRQQIIDNLETILELIPDEEKIMQLAEQRGKGEVLWPLRAALSGKKASPGPLEIMAVLGKTESAKRVKRAIAKLAQ